MIYFFCNETYGKPFLETARNYAIASSNPITIVLSGKRKTPKKTLPKLIAHLKFRLWKFRQELRLAKTYGLPVWIVENINQPSFQRLIQPNSHGIVAGFNQIFRQSTIDCFKSLVNFHPSVLPLYRGPVPSYWCIQNQEKQTGYTLHQIAAAIDAGTILFQEAVEIGDIVQPESLDQEIARKAVVTLHRYLDSISTGNSWNVVKLDASQIYRVPVDYASFPE